MKEKPERRLFRPKVFHLCHQKPNTARETVPLTSVADPRHFGVDPDPDLDPRIHASD
jgi:hypothetical protein